MKKLIRKISMLMLALCVSFGLSTLTNAWEHLAGDLDLNGELVMYNTWRLHEHYGDISLNVTSMPSGHLRVGLRNARNYQFSKSFEWSSTGTQVWTCIHGGTRFAVNARLVSRWRSNGHWDGYIDY